eukprot:2634411-Pleurochrysis_carterae.AAC.2
MPSYTHALPAAGGTQTTTLTTCRARPHGGSKASGHMTVLKAAPRVHLLDFIKLQSKQAARHA